MKKLIYSITIVLAALAASSCQRDVIEPESVIKDSTVEMNDFDRWLEVNFLKPYNIEFKYRYALNESDMGFYTVPADVNSSIIYAHLVKYLCIDTYDEIAGVTFTRSYFPKMFFLIGTWEYRNNGSIVLGTAEAGKKIMLAGVNELFKQITSATYVADACFDTDEYWRGRGYITAYAQSEPREDFAELLSEYVTHNAAWWAEQISAASKETAEVRKTDPSAVDGASLIESKIDIVRNYMQDSWNIDIDELRDIVNRRMGDVVAGKVDLNTVEIL